MTTTVTKKIESILSLPDPVKELISLHERGELEALFPELEESWGFNQHSKYHNLSLTGHTLAVLDKVVKAGGGFNVRLAALLHDIAKYQCYQEKTDGTYSFIGHDKASARLAKEMLLRCGFSKNIVNPVVFLIEHHMIIKDCCNPYSAKDEKTRRIARTLGKMIVDEMILIEADNLSHAPEYCLPGQVESFMIRLAELKLADHKLATLDEITQEFHLKSPKSQSAKMIMEILCRMQDKNPDISKEEAFRKIHKGNGVNKKLKDLMLHERIQSTSPCS